MRRALIILSVIISTLTVLVESTDATALSACLDVKVVGVRGSGQLYTQSAELNAIKKILPSTYKFTELENKIDFLTHEPEYLATSVKGDMFDNAVGLGALTLSRLDMGKYSDSVDSGKNLLRKYIEHLKPTGACVVLVGYSQGAQVINETVRDMHKADSSSLSNIIYIGLFGDPLYSPNGFDKMMRPTWLRGDALYPFWGVLYKDQEHVVVGQTIDYVPRNPSNPLYPFTKIGSWCNYGDVICATNASHFAALRDGHGTYTHENAQEMVDEIRAAVANPDQNITGAIYPTSVCGAAKQDMVVLLDTSAYMRRNKDLFTDAKNSWDTKLIPGTTQRAQRTFGEQLLDSGCGDKRIAIVGFDGVAGQEPRVLLGFTSSAGDIDTLMNSLYTPSSGGAVERPKLREAAILGMQQNWRPDASRTLLALTPMVGAGPAPTSTRETWNSTTTMNMHMGDAVGQQLLALSRQTRASIITAANLPIDMNGFTVPNVGPGALNVNTYLDGIARLTGGYNWAKVFVLYSPFGTVKNVDFSSSIQQFEKRRDSTRVAMQSVKAKVGQTVTLSLDDSANLLASAAVRSNGTSTEWYVDCDALQQSAISPVITQSSGKITFKPVKAGTCTGAVRVAVQANGNGCYFGCPEPFPPYMLKMIPFKIEVRPADYVDKVPGNITEVTKTLYDDRVEFTWLPPTYSGGDILYLVKDNEGSVLGMTTKAEATVTDTEKLDVDVVIQAVGTDGRSEDVESSQEIAKVIDYRTVQDNPVVNSPLVDTIIKTILQLVRPSPTEAEPVATQTAETGEMPVTMAGSALGESVVRETAQQIQTPAVAPVVNNHTPSSWWLLIPVIGVGSWVIHRVSVRSRRN